MQWLEYITFSTTSFLGREQLHVFMRDEYQENSGNLSHIHGLIALKKKDLESNEELRDHVCSLQRNDVCSLLPPDEMQDFIAKGLFKDERDWVTCVAVADEVLTHYKCDKRCQIRIGDGDGPENFRCRKKHPVRDSENPLHDDFIPINYKYTTECLEILEEIDLWEPPSPGAPLGTYKHKVLRPTRHMGVVHPGAKCNMSPTNPELFAALRSMTNLQVITDTNGVSRYVVKVTCQC